MIGWWRLLLRENFADIAPPLQNADFQSIFARSASAVTPSKKGSINTNRKSLRAFQWAQEEHRTLSLSLQRVTQKRSVQNLNIKLW